MKKLLICLSCGKEYTACPTCEGMRNNIWTYRQDFCSIECFKNNEKFGGKEMRIVTNENKTYTISNYDLKKGEYTATNNEVFTEENINSFMMTKDDYKKIKAYKEVKQVVKKEEVESEEE